MTTPESRMFADIMRRVESVVKVEALTLDELVCDESAGHDPELLAVCAQRLLLSGLEARSRGGERRPARSFAERVPWTRGAEAAAGSR